MKDTGQPQKQFIEMLQKHNLELTEQCKKMFTSLKEKDDLITCYANALRSRVFEMQKIVDISMLSGENNALISEKIKKWILSYHSLQSYPPLNINIQELTNMCCGNVITYLKEKYPSLNNDELTICSYICLNFSSDQIRYVLDYKHEHSLYNKRHKIKCKIDNESQRELDVILKELIISRLY